MSFDANPLSNNRPATETIDTELDLTLLASLVAESEEIPTNNTELSDILAHLDSAYMMASGVEAKVDGILSTLDNLLTSLESKSNGRPQEVTADTSA